MDRLQKLHVMLLLCPGLPDEPDNVHGSWWMRMRMRMICQIWIHPEASVLYCGSLVSDCCTGG